MKKKVIIGLFISAFILFLVNGEFRESTSSTVNFGWFSLVPPVVSIILAFISKDVIISLFLGIFAGGFVLHLADGSIFYAFVQSFLSIIDYTLNSLADPWNAGIILQVLTIGGLIALMTKMGGAKAVANALSKKAKGPISTQVITWILGILLFFDDYANSLIVGPVMRPVTDEKKVSREKLSFIVDATAAPIAGIALISTWVGYEVGLIKDGYEAIGQEVNAYSIFVETIPYRFYNILMLLFVLCTAVMLKEFGPMLTAERRARKYDENNLEELNPSASNSSEIDEMEPVEGVHLSIWNAIVPIGTLIVVAIIGFYLNGYNGILAGDNTTLINLLKESPYSFTAIQEAFGASDASIVLFQAALLASLVAMAMGVYQKTFTWGKAVETWINGMKSLIITGAILLLAWSLSEIITDLGTAQFLVSLLSDSMPAFLLPSVIFVLGSIISFATGTSYGTMGILMPLAIPLAAALSPDPGFIVMSAGAVLTGAIFGDHCSPISDTTILSSMGAGVNHMEHVKTQLPYALVVGVITVLFGFLPVGLGMPIWIVLPVSMIVIILVVYFFGKSVEEKNTEKV
ncbi:Na+/H+ antiporter NhaC family protein [Carnobacterium viridans]|uniref:Na+/H+ antiporter NhaC n=1 Tax=Carnobacterium viridans TaxID=174587 RepID=A0A1H1AKP0_9LACT|nr:Na+/H+ antiporter NhaC family protein [Carnobacterium viridans]UDE96160.1 Na+/H+ antiporter NhaC family protein [Carnobacterium viridans]SDQ40051.1 Na+/H+ antiporter NhaC [Carnobacterium viridans]